jgi:hypothetical protein
MATAASLAYRLGAQRQGHNWRCPCPLGCGYSLSLCDTEDGKLLAYCFGGCDYNDVLSALVEYGLLEDGADFPHHVRSLDANASDELHRIETARWIYDCCASAAGTLVETYLRSRHITINVPPILRFRTYHHRIGVNFPAMVAPVVNIDGELVGTHATFLRPDGNGKAPLPKDLQRECRGVVSGGTIRLAAHDAGQELLVGEGLESTMSAAEIFGLPAWSAVSAGGLRILELPSAVRRLCIAADNDDAGRNTAVIAARRWKTEGRAVRIVLPAVIGDDFNDVLAKRRT